MICVTVVVERDPFTCVRVVATEIMDVVVALVTVESFSPLWI